MDHMMYAVLLHETRNDINLSGGYEMRLRWDHAFLFTSTIWDNVETSFLSCQTSFLCHMMEF